MQTSRVCFVIPLPITTPGMRAAVVTLSLLVAPASGFNAASVWGIEPPNASYFPTIANMLFQPDGNHLRSIDAAYRASAGVIQGLYQVAALPRPAIAPIAARAASAGPPPPAAPQISWTEDTAEKKAKGYCESPIPRFGKVVDCQTIRHDVDAHVATTLQMLRPWRDNGTVVGIFLGDERLYHGVSLQNLTYVTRRASAPCPQLHER